MVKNRKVSFIKRLKSDISASLVFYLCLFIFGCKNSPVQQTIAWQNKFLQRVLNDTSDYYYINLKASSVLSPELPIGMFDSGTGGLTVLNAMVEFDEYNNADRTRVKSGDGKNDFANEHFIYFGDQANMPYGHYSEVNRTGFLKELIYKDALFLLGNKYYRTPDDKVFQRDKQTVKLIVIACNTATAFGKNDIEMMLSQGGSIIEVVGVIDAGVRGAFSTFKKNEDGTIAVIATAGTVASDGYLNTFNKLRINLGYSGKIEFIQHAGAGIAEAIDEEPDYIVRKATRPGSNYKGPSLTNPKMQIIEELLPVYNYDTQGNSLLRQYTDGQCTDIHLNTPENYFRFHLVSLCEKMKKKPVAKPLKTLILGCTHYPYYSSFIRKYLKELYNLKSEGKYLYRDILCDSVILIDPAENTAKEVYEYLAANNLLNKNGDIKESEFYISVADNLNNEIRTDSLKRFIYDYKYGRDENHSYDTKQVPVSRINTSDEIISRFRKQIPGVFELIRIFQTENSKTSFFKPDERF